MTITGMEAAKKFCTASKWTLSNLELQKMLYITHVVYFGRHKAVLLEDCFYAWDYGPVLPNVYKKLKIYGADPVGNIFKQYNDLDKKALESQIIEEAYTNLKHLTPAQLVALTHVKNGAWEQTYTKCPYTKINDELILQEYENEYHGKT